MITNIHKGSMGTIDFEGKFQGMRKVQDFCVYPIHAGQDASRLKIQSDTRIGYIDVQNGHVMLSPARAGGSFNHHLVLARHIDTLSGEELLLLKAKVFATAGGKVGNVVMHTDNSGAIDVFQQ